MSKTNLIGIDKWLIDLSFIEEYWKKSLKIIRSNRCEFFFQTRIFLEKFYTERKFNYGLVNYEYLNIELIEFLENNFENYISNNLFLYDETVIKKCNVENFNENSEFKNAIVVHPTIFAINLSILLYFKNNTVNNDNNNIFSRINFELDSHNNIYIDFSKNNLEVFKNKYSELIKKFNNCIKINIKNFYESITESVLRKQINKKFNLDSNNLEIILNYTKHICSNNNRVIPIHEFSPLYSYLATSCVLEGIILDTLKPYKDNINKNLDLLCYVDDIYIFSNSFSDCLKFKKDLSKKLLVNDLEINELKSEIKNYEEVVNLDRSNDILFIRKLVEEIEKNDECINYLNIFKKVIKDNNISNPFHSLLDINSTKIEKSKCDELSEIVNGMSSKNYLKMIDINPKYFILFLKRYNNTTNRDIYPLKQLINKFAEYKNDKRQIINESYYIYYYINFSFIGLYKNIIDDLSFPKISKKYNINFQRFIKEIFEFNPKKNMYKIVNSKLKKLPIKKIMSLLFFLENQFLEDKYNDCVLIISALFDLIKSINKNVKYYLINKCLCCTRNINDFLTSNEIDPLVYEDWDRIYRIRCELSSCHLRNNDEDHNHDYLSINEIKKIISKVIKWVSSKKSNDSLNNYLKLLVLLQNKL